MTDINTRMQLQRDEFDAADEFAKRLRSHNMTPVVDDDYPTVRGRYESALARFIDAMDANGRFKGRNGSNMRKAWEAGFIEACKWPEPVTQDVDSPAAHKARDAQVEAILAKETP